MISIINYYNSALSGEKKQSLGNSSPSSDLPETSICLLRRYKSLRPFIPLCGFRDLHTEQKCSLVTLEKQQRFNILLTSYLSGTAFQSEELMLGKEHFQSKQTFL